MSAWSSSTRMFLPSPLGALPSCLRGGSWSQALHLCPHAGPRSFLSHLLFWNLLPDSARPPPRLLLSGLKYQSLPYEVRRDTLAAPARQENAGISSVFRVRISLSSSLSALPSQRNRRRRLTAHSFHTHWFPETTLRSNTRESPNPVAQVVPPVEIRKMSFLSSQLRCCGQINSLVS